jgi:hypothetical protein
MTYLGHCPYLTTEFCEGSSYMIGPEQTFSDHLTGSPQNREYKVERGIMF